MNIGVILGGGVTRDGGLPVWVKSRCDYVLTQLEKGEYDYVIISSRYTFNKPVLRTSKGNLVYENKAILDYLVSKGFDENKVFLESSSVDTIGSIAFSFDLIRKIFSYDVIETVEFVTSQFHIRRVELIADHIKVLFKFTGCVSFPKLPSDAIDSSVRIERELNSSEIYCSEWLPLSTEKAFWEHLYTHHDCYSLVQCSAYTAEHNAMY